MSSKAPDEMECGTSLAEDAWAVPSISGGMATPNADNDDGAKMKMNIDPPTANSPSSSVEDAWNKIHMLRSMLASDVISDPPSPSFDDDNYQHNFPTFISPYEHPNSKEKSSNTPHKSYKGMAIPLVYCDQTASQRPVRSIEDYIRCTSMPCHANTHTVSLGLAH